MFEEICNTFFFILRKGINKLSMIQKPIISYLYLQTTVVHRNESRITFTFGGFVDITYNYVTVCFLSTTGYNSSVILASSVTLGMNKYNYYCLENIPESILHILTLYYLVLLQVSCSNSIIYFYQPFKNNWILYFIVILC